MMKRFLLSCCTIIVTFAFDPADYLPVGYQHNIGPNFAQLSFDQNDFLDCEDATYTGEDSESDCRAQCLYNPECGFYRTAKEIKGNANIETCIHYSPDSCTKTMLNNGKGTYARQETLEADERLTLFSDNQKELFRAYLRMSFSYWYHALLDLTDIFGLESEYCDVHPLRDVCGAFGTGIDMMDLEAAETLATPEFVNDFSEFNNNQHDFESSVRAFNFQYQEDAATEFRAWRDRNVWTGESGMAVPPVIAAKEALKVILQTDLENLYYGEDLRTTARATWDALSKMSGLSTLPDERCTRGDHLSPAGCSYLWIELDISEATMTEMLMRGQRLISHLSYEDRAERYKHITKFVRFFSQGVIFGSWSDLERFSTYTNPSYDRNSTILQEMCSMSYDPYCPQKKRVTIENKLDSILDQMNSLACGLNDTVRSIIGEETRPQCNRQR